MLKSRQNRLVLKKIIFRLIGLLSLDYYILPELLFILVPTQFKPMERQRIN